MGMRRQGDLQALELGMARPLSSSYLTSLYRSVRFVGLTRYACCLIVHEQEPEQGEVTVDQMSYSAVKYLPPS